VAGENVTSLSLLERLRGQDQQAWQRLVTLYAPLVYHWCAAGGVRGKDANDVVQEVFLAVSLALDDFERRQAGSFRGWLRGVTRHKLLDHFRRRHHQPAAEGGSGALERMQQLPDPEPGEQDEAEASGLYRRALELIRGDFEERTWQAFWRCAVDGQRTDLVAAELGMSAVAVRIAKSRVLGRLRAEVGDLIR
jgi:RNA polymerase sigma-70 factor, ECF subfamily